MPQLVLPLPARVATGPLKPPRCLVMGPAGSGKTTSLATLARAGIEVFVIATEPAGTESLIDAWERLDLNFDLLHYKQVPPTSPGLDSLLEMGIKANNMSYKDISEMKQGIAKEKMKQWPILIRSIQNFIDDRTGEDFGDATSWGANRALAFDSLSGLNEICMQNTVGFKPSPHQGEWGIAMKLVENLLLKMASDLNCYFILTSHIEKEPDEITGMAKVGVSTLGRKLAPRVPRFFSEVIRARKSGDGKYLWSTQDPEADLKNRALTSSNNLPQDFGPIVDAHNRRLDLAK